MSVIISIFHRRLLRQILQLLIKTLFKSGKKIVVPFIGIGFPSDTQEFQLNERRPRRRNYCNFL